MTQKKKIILQAETKGVKQAEGQFKKLGGSISKAGAIISTVFASAALMGAARLSKMAATAEGVKNAFDKLNKPGLLDELRKATRGTATDFELMQRAVGAANFKISLESLPKLLKFAQMRARDTGEEVGYLVESIITGIGRKSPLILDNLGLSAIQVREEFKKTGDMAKAVANIIDEEFEKNGESAETIADKYDRVAVSFDKIQRSTGDLINKSVEATGVLDEQTGALEELNTVITNIADPFAALVGFLFEAQKWAMKMLPGISGLITLYKLLGLETAKTVEATDDAIDGMRNFWDITNDVTDATKKEMGAVEAIWAAEQKRLIALQNYSEVIIPQVIDVTEKQIEQNERLAKSIKKVEESTNELHDKWLDNWIDMIEASDALTQSFGDAFAGVLERAAMSNQDFFTATIQGFQNMIAQMISTLVANAAIFAIFKAFGVPGADRMFGGGSLLGLLGFADGGPVTDNKPIIVGERGPEIFVPPSSGTIIPNEQVGVTINFNGNVTDKRYVQQFIIPEIQKSMRRGI